MCGPLWLLEPLTKSSHHLVAIKQLDLAAVDAVDFQAPGFFPVGIALIRIQAPQQTLGQLGALGRGQGEGLLLPGAVRSVHP
jgi:hypothetical protein